MNLNFVSAMRPPVFAAFLSGEVWSRIFAVCLFPLIVPASVAREMATNSPFTGITIYSVTETNPPARLFVAIVELQQPTIRLRTARGGADPDGEGPWQTTLWQPTKIAAREKFALVVNGDFFRARGVNDGEGTNSGYRPQQWGAVLGPAVSAGQTWAVPTNARPCLVVREDGGVRIQLMGRPEAGMREVIAGNVLLLAAGRPVSQTNRARHPRTAIGLDARRERLVLLVADGRKPGLAVGMTYEELAQELLRWGCADGLNLDGGGSSVMAVSRADGHFQILNQPTDGRERAVANVLGVTISSANPHLDK